MITKEEYVDYFFNDCGYAFAFSESIINQIHHKLWISNFSRGKVLYSLIVGYINRHVLNYNEALTYNYLTHIVGGSLAPYFKSLINYTINKQKESEMKEKEFVLTEDVSLYQFRNKPERAIIEILIPKNEEAKKLRFPIRVFYKENWKTDWLNYTLDGRYSTWESEQDADIILKPQKRPFTHEEILDLRREFAVFRRDCWTGISYVSLLGMSCEHYNFSNSVSATYLSLIKEYRYSLDDGKTWRKLEKEV